MQRKTKGKREEEGKRGKREREKSSDGETCRDYGDYGFGNKSKI